MVPHLHTQILLGLNHMHSKKILHRDIKTLNVFLDDNLNVKLGDMGVAKVSGSLMFPETSQNSRMHPWPGSIIEKIHKLLVQRRSWLELAGTTEFDREASTEDHSTREILCKSHGLPERRQTQFHWWVRA